MQRSIVGLALVPLLLTGCATASDDDSVAAEDSFAVPADVPEADREALAGAFTEAVPADIDPAEPEGDTGGDSFDNEDAEPQTQTATGAPPTLDASPAVWSQTASGAMTPLTNGTGMYPDGSALYTEGGKVKLRRPTGTVETIATGTNAVAIPGGPVLGAVYLGTAGYQVAWRGTSGAWTTTSLGYTTGGGSPTPSGCVDAQGNGTIALVNSTVADPEGMLAIFPITNSVVGRAVVYTADDEATAPAVVCSSTGPDEVVWRHQVASLSADLWHATLDAGRITGATKALVGGYDPSYAAGQWVGYHDAAARTLLGRSSDGGATFVATRNLGEASKFAVVATSGRIIAGHYSTWSTPAQANDPTRNQSSRVARMTVSLDGGVSWTQRDPFGNAGGYGPCTLSVSSTAILGACKSPQGIAGFSYRIQ